MKPKKILKLKKIPWINLEETPLKRLPLIHFFVWPLKIIYIFLLWHLKNVVSKEVWTIKEDYLSVIFR